MRKSYEFDLLVYDSIDQRIGKSIHNIPTSVRIMLWPGGRILDYELDCFVESIQE